MSYEFGANWAGFSRVAGSVNGPLLSYEVLTAFFLEAGFLGIMLFGWKRVGARLHFLATCLVALGTLFSAFWILASNSWMQTPQGFHIVDGRVVPLDWWEIVFNPSFPFRLVHMSLAAFIVVRPSWRAAPRGIYSTAAAAAGITKSFSMAVGMILVVGRSRSSLRTSTASIRSNTNRPRSLRSKAFGKTEKGWHALNSWDGRTCRRSERNTPYRLPHLGSLILTHTWSGEIRGLKEFAPEDRPDSTIVFWSFRIMVGMGLLMLLLGVLGLVLRCATNSMTRAGSNASPWLWGRRVWIALLAGWITTEVGRQPWVATACCALLMPPRLCPRNKSGHRC